MGKSKSQKCEYPAGRKAENKQKKTARGLKRIELKKIHRMTRIKAKKVSLRELIRALNQKQVTLDTPGIDPLYNSLLLGQLEKIARIKKKAKARIEEVSPFAELYA